MPASPSKSNPWVVFLPLPQPSKLAPRVCLPPLAVHQRGSQSILSASDIICPATGGWFTATPPLRYPCPLPLLFLLLHHRLPGHFVHPVSFLIFFLRGLPTQARTHARSKTPLPIGLVSLIIPRPGAHELSLSLEGKPRQARLDLWPHPRIPALEACNLTKLPLFGPRPTTSLTTTPASLFNLPTIHLHPPPLSISVSLLFQSTPLTL